MKIKFTRAGETLHAGRSVGQLSESPNYHFAVGWYRPYDSQGERENAYVLLSGETQTASGVLTERILDGIVCDTGCFALRHMNESETNAISVFGRHGEHIFTRVFSEYVQTYGLHLDGASLFFSERNKIGAVDLATQSELFTFEVEPRFYPSGIRWDAQSGHIEVQHAGKKWYGFTPEGVFLSRAAWFNDYLEDCDGEILYRVIKELHRDQGISGEGEVKTYASWIEEALHRGIKDSLHVTTSEVYQYLAQLHHLAGNEDGASAALEASEQSLDGFRLVDRVDDRIRSLGAGIDPQIAQHMIADLDRAQQTKRLFEHPNYVGRLFRAKGELLEMVGDTKGAVDAYKTALEANPKAGCAKRLKVLSNGQVAPSAKPKPVATEDRIRLDKLTMFHFRCPLCGAVKPETSLLDYLKTWETSGQDRLRSLCQHVSVVTSLMRPRKLLKSKKFEAACEAFAKAIDLQFGGRSNEDDEFLSTVGNKGLWMNAVCPVCETPSGAREKDAYFTHWQDCCRVQGSNLFYETGIIGIGLHQMLPHWLSSDAIEFCTNIASLSFRVGEAIGLGSCPQCGRFTTAIFGGSRTDSSKGMCRWCFNLSGAGQITINIDLNKIISDAVSRLSPENTLRRRLAP